MFEDVSPEQEERFIEQTAQFIIKNDLEDIAMIALEGTAPFGDVVGELGIMMSYPFAVTLFSRTGGDFVKMFGLNYEKNAIRLQERIKKLAEEKEIIRQKQRKLKKLNEKQEGWFSQFFSNLRGLFKPQNGES